MSWATQLPASIMVSLTKRSEMAQAFTLVGDGQNFHYRLYHDEQVTVYEYRGVEYGTMLMAMHNGELNYDNRTSRPWTPVIGVTFEGLWIEGDVSTTSATRANEANGWTITRTVTSVSTRAERVS